MFTVNVHSYRNGTPLGHYPVGRHTTVTDAQARLAEYLTDARVKGARVSKSPVDSEWKITLRDGTTRYAKIVAGRARELRGDVLYPTEV